jgi:alpha/beta superfamily hydrolase
MLNEKPVFFITSGDIKIEALYAENHGITASVITHPHPLMGGNMWNNVVEVLTTTFYEMGFSTLRFNFRGVGQSEGFYNEGIGEQDDLIGAINFLKETGKAEIVAGGYSFGAWIISRMLSTGNMFSDIVFVSPPIGILDFDFQMLKNKIGLVICGDHDPFCSIDAIKHMSEQTNGHLEILLDADHFYFGKESMIKNYLKRYLSSKD